jgi:hypothetical protein
VIIKLLVIQKCLNFKIRQFHTIIGNFIGDGIVYVLGVMIGYWAEDFKSDLGTVAFIGSIMNGIAFGNGPIVGCLIKKFGARRGK